MGRAGRRVRAAAALAVGAVPFALGVGTAAADDFFGQTFSREHTFTAGNGQQVTCTFSGESSLTHASGASTSAGTALTRASGEDPACGVTFVQVLVTYVDGSGRQRSTGADSVDGDVRWFGDDVARDFSVVHRVSFDDCLSNCDTSFTTSPK
jgi:hypothetical protein